jgi:diguanylate cyclase (GGDEF)-like protein
MKQLKAVGAIVLGLATAGWAEAPAPLKTLRAIHALTNPEASHALPVAFEASVTYFRGYERTLFVQEDGIAIYVHAATEIKLVPGDRILVRGTTHASFHPYVESHDITLLSHGDLPRPVHANFDQMIRAQTDCMRVTVRAIVRSADSVVSSKALVRTTYLRLLTEGGYVDATVDSDDESALNGMLDAEVEVTGVYSGQFDSKMQQTGILMHVSSKNDVKVLKRAGADPWSLAVTPMGQVITGYHVRDFTRRIHVQGTITYYQPGSALVLQRGSESLWILTQTYQPLHIGDHAEAIGFPDVHNGFLALTRSEVKPASIPDPVTPAPATWRDLSLGGNDSRNHVFDLVSIEGTVVMQARAASQDEYVLFTEGHLFTAIYRHPDALSRLKLPPMNQVPIGSRVRVTGICVLEDSNPFNGEVPFNILLRSVDDIAVVAKPSPLNMRNLIFLVGLLLIAVAVAGGRGWVLERKVRRQTAALAGRIEVEAALDRRRSRILEDINSGRPLAEILEQIMGLVSFTLRGDPCWCQIAGSAHLGDFPPEKAMLEIVRREIPSRSGPIHGELFVGIDAARSGAPIAEALGMGVSLAALAIETRGLYSDLVHRSEFDLLTDIHNRFSLDKCLDASIEEARMHAGIFGLIYIDLDEFKLVNDRYGHHTGDLYLQEAAARMKRQLRPGDLLARLGGDEFAVLVRVVKSRSDVQEIALRLESCFDEVFSVDEHVVRGSASVGIALYAEDGTTRDSLLRSADSAMYLAKHAKRPLHLELT